MLAFLVSLWCAGLAETEIFQAILVSIEPEKEQVRLQRKGGSEVQAELYKKARYWLRKAPASLESFRQMEGATVMIRMSVRSGATPAVREMADLETWKWLEKVRRGVVKAKLIALEEELLTAEFADGTRFTYRVTPKTQWERDGQPASRANFRVGETVYLVPRLLSNLDTMLLIVSNNEKGAQIGRERSLPTVSGTLEVLDLNKQILRLRSKSGDVREFRFDDQTEFVKSGQRITADKVRLPANVTVHRRKESEGTEYAKRVTIHLGTTKPRR